MKGAKSGQRAGNGGDTPPASVLSEPDGQVLTVSQLAAGIDRAIRSGLPAHVLVEGEISSLSHRTHYYFSLKDEHSVIGAVFFASSASKSATRPEHGRRVIAKGRVEFYAPSGRVSLIVTRLTPVGLGELEQRYQKLVTELRARGWFDPDHKRALPSYPRRVAVVTSKDGAAVQDVIDTFKRRCPGIELCIVDVRVQGDSAKGQISAAIRSLNDQRDRLGLDAIILTRGGGSLEDLWAFNEPDVVRAVFESSLPIVAAIGHETDTTIAELVADERAATPTQAAMRLSPDRSALIEQLASLCSRLDRSIVQQIRFERQRIRRVEDSSALRDPRSLIEVLQDRLDSMCARLAAASSGTIAGLRTRTDRLAIRLARVQPAAVHARRQERLKQLSYRLQRVAARDLIQRREDVEHTARELHAIGPAQVLSRGFSITLGSDGRALRSVSQAHPGDQIETVLHDGRLRSAIESEDGQRDPRLAKPSPPQRRPRRQRKPGIDDGPGLFE